MRSEDEERWLIPAGNPTRPSSLSWALAGLVPLFLLLACDRHFAFSVPLGGVALLIVSYGVLDALGSFDDARATPRARSEPVSLRRLLPRLLELSGAVGSLTVGLRLAVAGVLPYPRWSSGVILTCSLVWCVVAVCRTAERANILDRNQLPFCDRRGFWLVLLNLLLYVPLLGSYSLSDPWETHYGEVAREMLARDDWLSFWWAQDGFFWSKPALDFWLQGLSFSVSGVHFMPDEMLSSAALGHVPAPEWAARLPVILLTVLSTYLLYKAVAKEFGTRAGFLAGLVLTTAPYWFLIAHQSMTDMPYVAPLTAALALIVLGMRSDETAEVRVYPVSVGTRVFGLSAFHLLFGAVLLTVVPQLVYLLTRNASLRLTGPLGFSFHWDEFFAGSGGGNCGLPGNEACRWVEPVNRWFQPTVGALVWGTALVTLLYVNRGERRVQRLYFLGAWFFTALSALAKGAPGLVLPIAVAFAALAAARRYKDFANLELVGLGLMFASVCLPWYVQMYMRHGPAFTDRLLFHDMYKRAFTHVHDTNTGDDVSFRYYVWQLGYGLFPWSGLAAAGLLWWARFGSEARDARAEVMAFLVLWFTIAFAMFTISLTKFHHYALPTVPPIAALTGVLLNHALGPSPLTRGRRALALCAVGFPLCAFLFVSGALQLLSGTWSGRIVNAPLTGRSWLLAAALLCASIALGWTMVRRYAALPGEHEATFAARYDSAVLALLGISAAVPIVLVGRDLTQSLSGDVAGPARLLHLFTYNYRRAWPAESLDFRGVLSSFTALFALAAVGFALPRMRRHAVALLCGAAMLWTAWALNVYLVESAPHWGQRETIFRYYVARKGPEEPFVAYQMNWKGENFYTGNRVPVFVSSGAKFKTWLAQQRAKGVKVMFFTTEHSRVSGLKSELGAVKSFRSLTDRALNNKFTLLRVEL